MRGKSYHHQLYYNDALAIVDKHCFFFFLFSSSFSGGGGGAVGVEEGSAERSDLLPLSARGPRCAECIAQIEVMDNLHVLGVAGTRYESL